MHRPSAEEFLMAVLDTLQDLPPELAARLAEVLKQQTPDRAQAIRRLFEECARD
jgi:Mn-dependent DtxR family transcriptional regulator